VGDRSAEARCAELAEQTRLLTLENELLAERAEETSLLGMLAERISAIGEVETLLAVGLEQIAVLENLPYVGCFVLDGARARLERCYTLVPGLEDLSGPFNLEPELVGILHDRAATVLGDARAPLPFFAGPSERFRPVTTVVVPMSSHAGGARFLVLASDHVQNRLPDMLPAMGRLAEMIAYRIENIELLKSLTLMNERLDRKVLERTLRLTASEVRNRTLFERAFDAFFVVDTDLVIRDVNRQACCSLGYSREELLGRELAGISADFDQDGLARIRSSLEQDEVLSVDSVLRRNDGSTFPVEARLGPIEISQERMILVEARDVSERDRLQEELLHAQKMEALGRLAGGVAHDFNNILTAIMGQVDLMREVLGDGHAATKDLDVIQAAGERATGLTRQLLAFSRKQVIEMRPLDLSSCITESARLLARVIDETIDLQLELDSTARFVLGDAVRIDQILVNLVINARDAMPRGGRLCISTARIAPEEDFPVPAPGGPPATGQYLVIRVADTGIGIPAQFLGHIFEPFFTTKGVGKGTGLGLSMVYGLAQQQQAMVRVHSKVDEGTVFEVIFPEIEAMAGAETLPESTANPTGTETVLLVEDDETIRMVMSRMLRKLGYQVLQAMDGAEALRVVAAHDGPLDLLLSDVVMPSLGGVGLARELKRRIPELPVVYMSGYAGEDLGPSELQAPGSRFLQKPVSFRQLAVVLRECLDRREAP
jgi:PAS domain S-box-containing protein